MKHLADILLKEIDLSASETQMTTIKMTQQMVKSFVIKWRPKSSFLR